MHLNRGVIADQVSILEGVILGLLNPGESYALVDFPNHSNVGDSAIWLGEQALLGRLLLRQPSYVCTFDTLGIDELLEAHPEGPILIHGGGNFGDIWPRHQLFREQLLALFPNRRIIQLPQTVRFNDPDSIVRSAHAINTHGDFHLLVRDRRSLEFAEANFRCPVTLTPDMAFGIGPLDRGGAVSHEVFMLLREDKEKAVFNREALTAYPGAASADWLEEPRQFVRLTRWRAWLDMLGRGGLVSPDGRLRYYNLLASGRLARGLSMLSLGKVVLTDRLHAHILSVLLDIPSVVLDNNYGKVHEYIDSWTHGYPGTFKVRSVEEAFQRLQALSKGSPDER